MAYNNSKPFFEDEDLKTPEHDEVLLWCLKDENILELLKDLYSKQKWNINIEEKYSCEFIKLEEYKIIIDETLLKSKIENIENEIIANLQDIKNCKDFKEQWYKNRIKDLKIKIENLKKEKEELTKKFQEESILKKEIEEDFKKYTELSKNLKYLVYKKETEVPIINKNNYSNYIKTEGYLDLKIIIIPEIIETIYFKDSMKYIHPFITNIEIKPSIKSLGEVTRQINHHKTFLPKDEPYLLITKTKDLKEYFLSQNIYVFEIE